MSKLLKIAEENLILIAVFILTITILRMIRDSPALTENEGFMYLATGIIITGLVNGIIQKNSSDQQKSQSETVQTLATAAANSTPMMAASPEKTEVVNITADKANVNEQPQPIGDQSPPASPRPSWVD